MKQSIQDRMRQEDYSDLLGNWAGRHFSFMPLSMAAHRHISKAEQRLPDGGAWHVRFLEERSTRPLDSR